jgi:hypothetical protein
VKSVDQTEKAFPPQIAGKPASISRLVKTLKAEEKAKGVVPGSTRQPARE